MVKKSKTKSGHCFLLSGEINLFLIIWRASAFSASSSSKCQMCTDNTFPYLQYYLWLVLGVLACYFDTSPEAMNYREATARARWKMLNHNFISVTPTACNNLVNQQKTKKHMFNFRWRCHAMERHIPQLLS